MPKIDESRPFLPVNIALLTISDTRSLAEDSSGDLLERLITADGHKIAGREVLKDDSEAIIARLRAPGLPAPPLR